MSADPDETSATSAPQPSRTTWWVRRIARIVLAIDFVVMMVAAFRLGFVDINDHPGLVTTIWITIPIFIIAFPLMGFRDPGGKQPRELRQEHQNRN